MIEQMAMFDMPPKDNADKNKKDGGKPRFKNGAMNRRKTKGRRLESADTATAVIGVK